MKREQMYRRFLRSLSHYLVFFLLTAFVITCCMMLFVTVLSDTLHVSLNGENLNAAARLTFANVLLLTFLGTVIDTIRRKWTIDRQVRRITEAAQRMMQGDFSVRIPQSYAFQGESRFSEIIRCLNQMAEELSGIETLRTDFVANVSHELKTPLAVLQNYGTLLQQPGLSDEKRMEYARSITQTSRQLADLISNILKLNKLENQQIFPEQKVYDLGEQLCECLLGFENAWEQKHIAIETDLAENVLVRSDAEMMALVWNNLFSNAIKFTNPGGTVRLQLQADERSAVVRVSDTGCGISKEVGARIFDKFYQGDTSHASQGNGLGLALVKRVVDITGSEIAVQSEVGKGTTFTVTMRREQHGTLQTDIA